MSVDITIKQKGIFKKKLSLEDILMNYFAYGTYDQNYILQPDERSENEITLYHPEHIARGISVIWNENETNQIGLHMLLPTTSEEINDLYLLIKHLCQLWKTQTFIQDGQEYKLDEIDDLKSKLKKFNYETMGDFLNQHENGNFFCAMWPYYFRSDDVRYWLDDQDLSLFSKDIHQNQQKDLYYANARCYQMDENQIMGVYTVTAGVDTIFPYHSMVPFSCVNFQTGESIQVDTYIVALISLEQEKMIGDIPFDAFIKEISKKELHEFDCEHFYFDSLSEAEIISFTQKYDSILPK